MRVYSVLRVNNVIPRTFQLSLVRVLLLVHHLTQLFEVLRLVVDGATLHVVRSARIGGLRPLHQAAQGLLEGLSVVQVEVVHILLLLLQREG